MKALIRRPGPLLAEGLLTHLQRQPVSIPLAERQWAEYVGALQANGVETIEVAPADDCPDAVFIEDAVVVFDGGIDAQRLAVVTRPGAVQRRGELATAHAAVAGAGYRVVEIDAPGTLDGGDVLKSGRTVYVGLSGRTNQSGIDQLRDLLSPGGFDVVAVPLSKVLHLKSAVTALPDGTVIGYPPLVDDPAAFGRPFLEVPEEGGAHVVLLGDGRLLMAASAPRTAEMLRGMGYQPVVVDISEFEKLEGCVTCLSVRLRSEPRQPGRPGARGSARSTS